jgi:hypothetical protein
MLFGASAAWATSTPTGGKVELWVTPGATQGNGTIIITGAIGDYGKTTGQHNENGTPNKNGTYGTAQLQKGTFEIDLANVGKAINNASPTVNSTTTCSYVVTATASAAVSNGTGAYKGISGTVEITETFAAISPRLTSGKDKGQCNESNSANPVAQWGSVTGIGTVSFS